MSYLLTVLRAVAITEAGLTLSIATHGGGLHHQSPEDILYTLKVEVLSLLYSRVDLRFLRSSTLLESSMHLPLPLSKFPSSCFTYESFPGHGYAAQSKESWYLHSPAQQSYSCCGSSNAVPSLTPGSYVLLEHVLAKAISFKPILFSASSSMLLL